MAASPAAISRASTALAATASSPPTASAALRPTAVEPTSSRRPASSSALVCLITMKMLIRPAANAETAPYLYTVRAPIEVPYSGPPSASTVGS